jgi:DNA repair exonuclease SbcCD ATPase subunit
MNFLLKERNSKIKEDLSHIEYQLSLNVEKIKHQEKYINEVEELNRESKQLKLSQIKAIQAEIKCIEVNIEQLTDETKLLPVSIDAKLALGVQLKSAFASSTKTMSQIQQLVKDAKFYEANDSCPVCEQHIEEEFKQDKINQCKHDAKEVHAAMEELKAVELTLTNTLDEVNKTIDELSNKRHEIKNSQTKITVMQSQIGQKHDELVNLAEKQTDVEAEQRELGELVNTKDGLVDRKIDCVEERTYNEVIGEMLKDTGIKTKIIKQYLPAMNKLINQYLQVLDFFVSFYLDEEFNETIRSRHRDDFQYTSFSEGEKQRIDLALLFTWRQIARMKNSTNTNLLILDETFDSSLDVEGLDNLTKILGTLNDDNNIFVISHKGDALESKFESKIEFYKDGNFSKIR